MLELRVYSLDPAELEPFEIGASIFAILAFPHLNEVGMMQSAKEALCADTLRVTWIAEPHRVDELRRLYARYAAIDERESRRRLRTFKRRLNDRMVAARMSMGFFHEAFADAPAALPTGMARLSLNQLSELVLTESRQSDPENVEKRIWRGSLPVIHIATAYQWMLRYCQGNSAAFTMDLQNLGEHRRILALSRRHEDVVLADRRFGVKAEDLVRLRLVDEPHEVFDPI